MEQGVNMSQTKIGTEKNLFFMYVFLGDLYKALSFPPISNKKIIDLADMNSNGLFNFQIKSKVIKKQNNPY